MHKRFIAAFAALAIVGLWLAAFSYAADSSDSKQYIGNWSGNWEGNGSGHFDLSFLTGSNGDITGGVNVTTDGGDYTAKFTSLSIIDGKLAAKYDYPLDNQAEVVITATFTGNSATGTWALSPKGESTALANGTWSVTKK